jgi:hypothetical protein
MCLVQCTFFCQNRSLISSSVDEDVLGVASEFLQRQARHKDSSQRSETATLKTDHRPTNVAILLRKMSLVRCTLYCQIRSLIAISVDEVVLGIRPEFRQQRAVCKASSRRSETATLKKRPMKVTSYGTT